jgi:hypothetical protein
MSENLSVDNIISDINNVLLKHFNAIVNKYESDRNQFENFVKGIPMVKNIVDENVSLKNKVNELQHQVEFLEENLKSLGQHFNDAVFNKDVKFKINNVETNFSKLSIDSEQKQIETFKENIELVINDCSEEKHTTSNEIDQIVEENLNKKREEFLKHVHINTEQHYGQDMTSLNLNDEDDESSYTTYMDIMQDDEDDTEEIVGAEKWAMEQLEKEAEDANDEEEEEKEDANDEEEDDEEEEDEEEEVENNEDDEEEEDEEEVIEIEYDGIKYYGNENRIGNIYKYLENGDVGDEIGKYVNGDLFNIWFSSCFYGYFWPEI